MLFYMQQLLNIDLKQDLYVNKCRKAVEIIGYL